MTVGEGSEWGGTRDTFVLPSTLLHFIKYPCHLQGLTIDSRPCFGMYRQVSQTSFTHGFHTRVGVFSHYNACPHARLAVFARPLHRSSISVIITAPFDPGHQPRQCDSVVSVPFVDAHQLSNSACVCVLCAKVHEQRLQRRRHKLPAGWRRGPTIRPQRVHPGPECVNPRA
jgi:hypothetical protein